LAERDARDIARTAAPLKPAPGAVILDTSELTVDESVHAVLALYADAVKLSNI
jgi:cytidylate kinase